MCVDFLYIGAPRAGSTWFEHMLARHPGVWLPPTPIIYFHPRFQLYRLKKLTRYMTGELVARDAVDKAWLRRYFARPVVSDRWYNSLFPSDKFTGEVAEAYCALPENRIAHIARLMPDLKIIFTMRNPVERALSHARRGVVQRKGRAANAVPESAYYWHIDHPSNEARTRYTAILDRWQRHFAPEQFHIAFYDQLVEDPESYFRDICTFLDVGYDPGLFRDMVDRRVNSGGIDDIPAPVKHYAADKYAGEIDALAGRFGLRAEKWRDQMAHLRSAR